MLDLSGAFLNRRFMIRPAKPPTSAFERFLIQGRRHWTLWTLAEFVGMGLLCGCGVALLLLPILIWRGEPGQRLAMVFPSFGILVGGIVGLRKRPSLGEIARLADDRFDTADLLATALGLRASQDPWNQNILKLADARSLGLSANRLTPHRLGPRAWSGIALTLIGTITLGLLSVIGSNDRAEAATSPAASKAWEDLRKAYQPSAQLPAPATAGAREARAEATPDSQSMDRTGAEPVPDRHGDRSDGFPREGQAEMAAGAGSAKTAAAAAAPPNDHPGLPSKSNASDGGIAASGDGNAYPARGDGHATAGTITPEASKIMAPWSSDSWPAARSAALNAIRDGRVPDAYRNMVRDYFQNDPR